MRTEFCAYIHFKEKWLKNLPDKPSRKILIVFCFIKGISLHLISLWVFFHGFSGTGMVHGALWKP
jgi:hypothetical protein